MSMSSTQEQIPPHRKRQHSEAGLSLDNPFESQPSKQLKSSKAEFYDSLSKVWLTRRALKELDRRTRQANSPQRPASTPRRLEEIYRESSKQIQRFARHGGPDLRDLRGYPAPADVEPTRAMASSSGSSRSRYTKSTALTSISSKTRRSSAYDKDFEQHYIDHRIYPKGYDYRDGRQTPEPGLEGLYQRLLQPRLSLSLSRFTISDFRDFERKNDWVISEGKVMSTVFPIISGNADIPNEENLQLTRLESMTGNVTVNPRPDFYDGARLEDIDRQVQEELGPYIIPTGHTTAPVAPNFFMEAKAPSGGADVARRQAMQDGAYGARAMHSLQSYSKSKPVYDGNAYTITSTYHAGTGTLQIYTTHLTQGETGPEDHMAQVSAWALTGNINSFREGATAFRNARDWAQEQRDAFINAANEKARSTDTEPTRTERMTYPDWLATLDQAQEPPASNQDSAAGHTYTAPSTFDSSTYHSPSNTYPVQHTDSSIFDSSTHNDPSNTYPVQHTDSSTFDSSIYNGPLNTYPVEHTDSSTFDPYNSPSNTYPIQESETSADELAFAPHEPPAIPSERRHRGLERTTSKAPRHGHGKSGGSRRSRRIIQKGSSFTRLVRPGRRLPLKRSPVEESSHHHLLPMGPLWALHSPASRALFDGVHI